MRTLIQRLEEARAGGRMANPATAIRLLAAETPSGRGWRRGLQVTFDETLAALGAVDAMYADQPTYKSDLRGRERREVVERLDKALEGVENVVRAIRELLRED